jgi:hypothetical protein
MSEVSNDERAELEEERHPQSSSSDSKGHMSKDELETWRNECKVRFAEIAKIVRETQERM